MNIVGDKMPQPASNLINALTRDYRDDALLRLMFVELKSREPAKWDYTMGCTLKEWILLNSGATH